MNTFKTLLLREWMQHKRGWLIVLAAPLLIGLSALFVGQVNIDVQGSDTMVSFAQVPALLLAAGAIIGTGLLAFVLAWLIALLQAPGLAWRDQQDRSIDFWLSLPIGHAAAVGTPLLTHLLLFPLAALVCGLLAGHVVSLAMAARVGALGEWLTLPWGSLMLAWITVLLRTALGLVLATLWLSPLIMLTVAAAAWFKRWGLPVLVVTVLIVSGLLDRLFGNPLLSGLGRELLAQAGRAFVAGHGGTGLRVGPSTDLLPLLQAFPAWAAMDAAQALKALASPLLLLALGVSAACFGLLMLRRQRAG